MDKALEEYKRVEKNLLDKGLINFVQESDGSTTLVMNLQFWIDIVEHMGDIPISVKVYKRLVNSNKRKHPKEQNNLLVAALANSLVEYMHKSKDVTLMERDFISSRSMEEGHLYSIFINKLYSLKPIRKDEYPDFYWFSPNQAELKSTKELAEKQDKSLFSNYKGFEENMI